MEQDTPKQIQNLPAYRKWYRIYRAMTPAQLAQVYRSCMAGDFAAQPHAAWRVLALRDVLQRTGLFLPPEDL